MSEFVVVSGMSGAGRSQVGNSLEDLGWFVIDNLPPSLVPPVAELALRPGSDTPKVALVLGAASADEVSDAVGELRDAGASVQLIFLDASDRVLVQRYESTKRRHPRGGADRGIESAIRLERQELAPLRAVADLVIDTSDLNVHQLRAKVIEQVGGDNHQMLISVVSFGFKNGVPADVDLVFDCRFLPNPYWVDGLREQTGRDADVQEFLDAEPDTVEFMRRIEDLLDFLVPAYTRERRAYLTIAFGCTGGRHRSVRIAEGIAARLREEGLAVRTAHRDLP